MLKMSQKGDNEDLSELKTAERPGVVAKDAMEEPPNRGAESESSAIGVAKDMPVSDLKENPDDANDDLEDDVAMTFPQRLMEILDNEDNADIISWLQHGRGFVIFRKKAFEQKVLPKYFNKQSKYSSFTRKLNRWGFTRVTRGPEAGAYYHQYFQKGGHRLLMQMSCQSSNKSAIPSSSMKKLAAAQGYSMSSSMPATAAGGGGGGAATAGAVGATSLSPSSLPMQYHFSSFVTDPMALHQQQQQQQLIQLQLQQQLLQQEATRRAFMASQARFGSSLPSQLQIPPVSFHQQQQQQDSLYSQLVAAQLAQAGLGGGVVSGGAPGMAGGGGGLGSLGGNVGGDLGEQQPYGSPGGAPSSSSLGANFLHWKNFPPT